MNDSAQHLVVMGVSGSGKTTVAEMLAQRLGWTFAEADEFHPQANIDKMTTGIPLNDDDRKPWLEAMRNWMAQMAADDVNTVVTCSALKKSYRDTLRQASGTVYFIHLHGSAELLSKRMTTRSGHFMPRSLLPSQLETLEMLGDGEDGLTLDIANTPEEIVDKVLAGLTLNAR